MFETSHRSSKRGFNFWRLVIGILYLIAAYFAYTNSIETLSVLSSFFAIAILFRGVHLLVLRRKVRRMTNFYPTFLLVGGLISLLIGGVLILHPAMRVGMMTYLFIAWFLSDAIQTLTTANFYRIYGRGVYWFQMLSGIIGVILAVMLLFNPLSAALTLSTLIAFYFTWFGILEIVLAF